MTVSTLAGGDGGSNSDPEPGTLWHYALLGDTNGIQRCLAHGADVNATDPELQMTPLHFAVDREQPAAVAALLQAGADVGLRDEEGWTPLHVAASCENREIYDLLLQSGADESATDRQGHTAASYCPKSWGRADSLAGLVGSV